MRDINSNSMGNALAQISYICVIFWHTIVFLMYNFQEQMPRLRLDFSCLLEAGEAGGTL